MTSLTESLELLKEQSKSKMMTAIEKMKELKGHLGSKTEEIAAGVLRITELEESLLSVNQEVVKYKSAMEKAMPKFRELKVQLDAKVSECDINEKENLQLKNRILELEGLGLGEKQNVMAPVDLLDMSDTNQATPSAIESVSGNDSVMSQSLVGVLHVESSRTTSDKNSDIVHAGNAKDQKDLMENDPKSKQYNERQIAEMVLLVAELKESNEDIKSKAALNEKALREEIETLQQVRTYPLHIMGDLLCNA